MTLRRFLGLCAFLVATALASPPAPAQGDGPQEADRLFRLGQHELALERVNAYIASRPRDARGHFLKGRILAAQNRREEAIRVFTELTQNFPELPEPYNNLAVLYAAQGQYDRARSLLEAAIAAHPGYAVAHENLGDIYARMAGQAYRKALQFDRGSASAGAKLEALDSVLTPGGRP